MVYSRAMVEVWKFGICFTGAVNRMCYKLDIKGGEREKEERGEWRGKRRKTRRDTHRKGNSKIFKQFEQNDTSISCNEDEKEPIFRKWVIRKEYRTICGDGLVNFLSVMTKHTVQKMKKEESFGS